MRGCSLSDSYIIIDEAQNTTPSEMKTIITRIGENSKLVLTGDIDQIDSPYLTKETNGLTMTVNKFKDHSLFGFVKLLQSERSELSKLANKLLFE
jgi:PhoH-like ATPase